MNYATQKTSRTTRFATVLLSFTITFTITGAILWGMTGGADVPAQTQLAVKHVPQVVAQR